MGPSQLPTLRPLVVFSLVCHGGHEEGCHEGCSDEGCDEEGEEGEQRDEGSDEGPSHEEGHEEGQGDGGGMRAKQWGCLDIVACRCGCTPQGMARTCLRMGVV